MRILAIDDEAILLRMIEASLKRICTEKDEITAVNSIKEFDTIPDKQFDIAFVDINIGRINGVTFAGELRGYNKRCNIIYVSSEYICNADIFDTRPSGYVLKPYTDDDIRKELADLRYPVDTS